MREALLDLAGELGVDGARLDPAAVAAAADERSLGVEVVPTEVTGDGDRAQSASHHKVRKPIHFGGINALLQPLDVLLATDVGSHR